MVSNPDRGEIVSKVGSLAFSVQIEILTIMNMQRFGSLKDSPVILNVVQRPIFHLILQIFHLYRVGGAHSMFYLTMQP